MADRSNAGARRDLAVNASRPPIHKDTQGSENPIPLSPQWLLPKPGDNKIGVATGGPPFSHHSAKHLDACKLSRNGGEMNDMEKKKDVFRPSFYDAETGRRDRWHDEERETISGVRRDHGREEDKELGDAGRTERWAENSSRHASESRRISSERWTDSGNRESNYDQRRESKWNTRWGPDDGKESENKREKLSDTSKDGEVYHEKGASYLTSHGKDINDHVKDADKDGEHHSRPWRSNSFLSRGRADTSHPSPMPSSKPRHLFGYGRGRGENGASVFPAGHGRANATMSPANSVSRSYSFGTVSDKFDGARADPSALRYSRMKLLDIYRMTDILNQRMPLEGFIEVPSLTLGETLEPLALSAPTPEELVILKGIDKGEIVSSGLPQVSKDASVGRNPIDPLLLKHSRSGNNEDFPPFVDDYKDKNTDGRKDLRLDSILNKGEAIGDVSIPDGLSPDLHIPRCQMEERALLEPRDMVTNIGPGWSHLRKDLEMEQNKTVGSSAHPRDGSLWQSNEELHSEVGRATMIRTSSQVLGQEREGGLLPVQGDSFILKDKAVGRKPQPNLFPEELTLYYKDPQSQIQGPFSGSDLIGWFEAGYFGIDLPVRLASASADAPFSLLGDVMPHLRMKSRPPPGFNIARQNDVEVQSAGKLSIPGNIHGDATEFELFKNGHNTRHGAANEAESRYFEALMSGNLSSSPSKHVSFTEAIQDYGDNSSSGMLPRGGESGNDINYLLSQQLSIEQQRSLPNLLQFWPGRDTSAIMSNKDLFQSPPIPSSKSLPPMGDNQHIPQTPQHPDLLSMLQAAVDKPSSSAVNSGIPVWSNFPDVRSINNNVHGNMGIVQDKIDIQQNRHFASHAGFAVHQRLQPQTRPSLPPLMNHIGSLSSSLLPSEKLLSAEISQDPQIRTLLQQKLLQSQCLQQSQPVLPSQLSPLDVYLLQQHQQQQQQKEQQQQQLLLQHQQHQQQKEQQQQHNLLSQVFSGHQSHQHFGEASYGHPKSAIPTGSTFIDQIGHRQMQEALQVNHQTPAVDIPNNANNPSNVNIPVSNIFGYPDSANSSNHLPHQMFDHPSLLKGWGSTLSLGIDTVLNIDPITAPAVTDSSSHLLEAVRKSEEAASHSPQNILHMENSVVDDDPIASIQTNETLNSAVSVDLQLQEGSGTLGSSPGPFEQVCDMSTSSGSVPEQSHVELPSTKSVKNGETREMKKSSEKKTKKQKNSKVQPAQDLGKGSSKTVPLEQSKQDSEFRGSGNKRGKLEVPADLELLSGSSPLGIGGETSPQQIPSSTSTTILTKCSETIERKLQQEGAGHLAPSSQTNTSHRAWKPAPGLKAKSLLEIQMEEQSKARMDTVASEPAAVVIPTNVHPIPWAGGISSSENKSARDIVQGRVGAEAKDSKSRKSQLHDLLAEEVLTKANEGDKSPAVGDDNGLSFLPPAQVGPQIDVAPDDNDFVEAKDSRKNRKKAAKAKNAGFKSSSPVASADFATPVEKAKTIRQLHREPESLPTPPAGPSLADFVPWRGGDQTNHAPAPSAWSMETAKLQKPASLRDILKEQEKKAPLMQQQVTIPTPTKAQANHGSHGSGGSWPIRGSSPLKSVSTVQTKTLSHNSYTSSQSKVRTEDDLFWAPLNQSKQETKQSDFPSLGNSSSLGLKSTPVKGVSAGAASRQNPLNNRSADHSISPSVASSQLKGWKNASTKHSEAMDFRDWCANELFRLTGSKDTSFLEYCLKQSTSEAGMLLRENLGPLDRNHEFIDKFLNYKDFLAPEVIDIAFQAQSGLSFTGDDIEYTSIGNTNTGDADADIEAGLDGFSKGVGKKKGKKGKKMSPSVLGFNVVSNRIMMGEIQTMED